MLDINLITKRPAAGYLGVAYKECFFFSIITLSFCALVACAGKTVIPATAKMRSSTEVLYISLSEDNSVSFLDATPEGMEKNRFTLTDVKEVLANPNIGVLDIILPSSKPVLTVLCLAELKRQTGVELKYRNNEGDQVNIEVLGSRPNTKLIKQCKL